MDWLWVIITVYAVIVVTVCLRIIYDTRSEIKTMSYLLVVIFVPVLGMAFYFSFGINYRKRKLYDRKEYEDEQLMDHLKKQVIPFTEKNLQRSDPSLQSNKELAYLLMKDLKSPLTKKNSVKLLLNGENKFKEVLEALRKAKHHIHIEYYIYEDDDIGREIEEILVQKVKEGVKVRFIYDDFGSSGIRKKLVKRLKEGGVEAHPFYRVVFILLANRLNYRNHRKIIIIDGYTAFTGGINVSDKYINNGKHKLYWRDTHIRIDGPGVYYLQYLFIADWNFCSGAKIEPEDLLFVDKAESSKDMLVQIAASGPDSDHPSILLSVLQAIYLAQKEILITTPYFIPGESIMEALTIAALSGLKVKLLVPGVSDIKTIDAAARSYYGALLKAGVEIYRYKKGFVHAKTMVCDGKLSIVGSANMDYRSFELNFEVNAIIYDVDFSQQLRDVFFEDLNDAEKIDRERWVKRPISTQLLEKTIRLLSPLM